MSDIVVQCKVPFDIDVRLKQLKRRTGINLDRLVYAAIIRYLEDVDNGRVPEISALERARGMIPERRKESGISPA